MVLDWAFVLPFLSAFMRRVGGVPASPHNAARLLDQDELVMVFPEGVKGTGKPFSERYRCSASAAADSSRSRCAPGAPIVPVAVVGSEEIYPKLGESPTLARAVGAPFVPITPTFPWLGPLGPDPAAVAVADRVLRADRRLRAPPEAAEDRRVVFDLSEQVRETIQEKLYENLVKRGLGLPLSGSRTTDVRIGASV